MGKSKKSHGELEDILNKIEKNVNLWSAAKAKLSRELITLRQWSTLLPE